MSLRCRFLAGLVLLSLFPVSFAAAGDLAGSVRISGPNAGAEVLVWVEDISRPVPAPVSQNLVLDQRNMRFTPLILPVPIGSTVEFRNSDDVHHNIFSPSKAKRFDLGTYPKTVKKTQTFDKAGLVIVLCNIHTNMESYLVVLDNPFYTMTRKDGTFLIGGIPPGPCTLKVFHPKLREFKKKIAVTDKGTLTMDVELVP